MIKEIFTGNTFQRGDFVTAEQEAASAQAQMVADAKVKRTAAPTRPDKELVELGVEPSADEGFVVEVENHSDETDRDHGRDRDGT